MKPILLKMTAFGPYADENIIDFTCLKNQNIFVITGPTGSGKTTIFDAICYALYARTSGNERSGAQLRSDFVNIGGPKTQVEFTFSVRDKKYYIKRVPAQMRKKLRGDGFIEDSASVEFMQMDSDSKPLTKESTVDKCIQEVVGLNFEQFRKIVMIPQGDFRDFLYANTTEKEEILRKIFDTHYYKKIQEKLKNKAVILKNEVLDTTKDIMANLNVIKCDENSKLECMIKSNESIANIVSEMKLSIKHDKDLLKHKEEDIKKLENDMKIYNEKLNDGIAINKKWDVYKVKSEEFKTLELRKNEFIQKNKKYINAKNSLYVLPYEINLDKKRQANKELNISFKDKTIDLNNLKNEFKDIKLKYENIKVLEDERDENNLNLNKLKSYVEDVESIESNKTQINILQKYILECKDEEKQKKYQNEDLKKQIDILGHTQTKLIDYKSKLRDSEDKANEYSAVREDLRKLYKACENLHINKELLNEHIVTSEIMQSERELLENAVNEKMDLFINGEAIRLANKLKDGSSCPVCGSTDHPNPKKSDEKIPTKDEVDKVQNELNQKNDQIKKNDTKILEIKLKINGYVSDIESCCDMLRLKKVISEQDDVFDYKNVVKNKGLEISNKMEKLNVDISILNKEISTIENNMKTIDRLKQMQLQLEKELEDLKNNICEISTNHAKHTEKLSGILRRVPEKFTNLNQLQDEISHKNKVVMQLDNNIKKIRYDYDKLNSQINYHEAGICEIKKNIIKSNDDICKDEFEFEEVLKKYFANVNEYISCKMKESDINLLQLEIEEYNNKTSIICSEIKNLEYELQGVSIVDTESIKNSIEKLKNLIKQETQYKISKNEWVVHNEKILKNVIEKSKCIIDKERQYKLIGNLANLADGKSANKVTFETFVLSSYFEDVLMRANERLQKMTNNRYYLIRKDESKGGGRKGLDLDIYDNYTCKSRAVQTLSGGESFKASLALALGLSDTVVSNCGGIQLDTMFIDEGFGTLDSDSLDSAIEILIQLQDNGRLIGIISHVNELKERIPAKLYVKASNRGSCVSFAENIV